MNALILGFPSVIFSHHTKALIKQRIPHNLAWPQDKFSTQHHTAGMVPSASALAYLSTLQMTAVMLPKASREGCRPYLLVPGPILSGVPHAQYDCFGSCL